MNYTAGLANTRMGSQVNHTAHVTKPIILAMVDGVGRRGRSRTGRLDYVMKWTRKIDSIYTGLSKIANDDRISYTQLLR